jgi:hypothetical protein
MVWTLPFLLLVVKANTMELLPEYSRLFLLQVLGWGTLGFCLGKIYQTALRICFF